MCVCVCVCVCADNDEEDCKYEEEYNADLVRERFIAAIDSYKEQILNYHQTNLQDPSMNNAMMAAQRL